MERAYGLELYDRGIQNPIIDQEQLTRDFLLGNSPVSRKDPDKYIKQQNPGAPGLAGMPMNSQDVVAGQIGQAKPPQGQSPLGAAMGQTPLPQTMGASMQ